MVDSLLRRVRHALAPVFLAGGFAASATTVTYTYDRAGRLTSAAYANGLAISYTYAAAGNLLERQVAPGGPTVGFVAPDATGDELTSPVLIGVELSRQATAAVTVQFEVTGGTADRDSGRGATGLRPGERHGRVRHR